ncbi:MAG TPA: alpha-E domain-containing protein [Mycobacteriales bacterium]|nr:alpha-E domain-containing protein [Mycobacteriales bacterium]
MLSRIAESLFWIGRLVERAEDVSRVLDVSVHLLLEDWSGSDAEICRALLAVIGVEHDPDADVDPQAVLDRLAYERTSPVWSSLEGARENARTVREVIPSELWVCLNTTYNALPAQRAKARDAGPSAFFTFVKDRAALLSGLADGTMSHDDGWRYVVLGRSLERADMTARALSLFQVVGDRATSAGALLRSCAAYESFLRTYRGVLDPDRATAFLLLDRLFPRSVYAALSVAERQLADLLPPSDSRLGVVDPALLALGRMRTNLEFTAPEEVMDDLPRRIQAIQHGCGVVTDAVAERFFRAASTIEWVAGGVS